MKTSASPRSRSGDEKTLSRQRAVLHLGLLSLLACGAAAAACQPTKDEEEVPHSSCKISQETHAEARLLTRSEYRRTVQDLLRTKLDPTKSFPPEPVVGGFENDASSHQANPLLVEKHAEAAATLAEDLLARGIDEVYECEDEQAKHDCAGSFIESFGTRAYRRTLTSGESDSLLSLYDQAFPTLGHDEALATVVEATLQSPQFLYRVEAPISQRAGDTVPLGPYQLASRLSYFLWGTMPDDELLEAARNDRLSSAEEVGDQARRLLEDDRAVARAREFHSQWLGLSRLSSIARDDAPEGATEAWEEATHRFIDGVLWGDTPTVSELFSSPAVHFDDTLAELYGQEASGDWDRVEEPNKRTGLLTQPGIMALFAHADQSSPIQRGVFVRESILCEEVEPPPPTVNNNPPDPDPELTTRERFKVHTGSPACANCHRLIDPLGFGLESYDHLGRFRTTENDLPIDTSGEVVEMPEKALEGAFDGAEELALRISESDTVLTCLARKWFTFAMGRAHAQTDDCSIDAAVSMAHDQSGNMRELLVQLTMSPAFRFRAAHESDEEATGR